jgi:hypothetical protein
MPLGHDPLDVDLDVNLTVSVSNTLDIDNDVPLSPRDDSSRKFRHGGSSISASSIAEPRTIVAPAASFQANVQGSVHGHVARAACAGMVRRAAPVVRDMIDRPAGLP